MALSQPQAAFKSCLSALGRGDLSDFECHFSQVEETLKEGLKREAALVRFCMLQKDPGEILHAVNRKFNFKTVRKAWRKRINAVLQTTSEASSSSEATSLTDFLADRTEFRLLHAEWGTLKERYGFHQLHEKILLSVLPTLGDVSVFFIPDTAESFQCTEVEMVAAVCQLWPIFELLGRDVDILRGMVTFHKK